MRADPFSWSEGHELLRATGSEKWLAQRIRDEREARGWSQTRLSKEMAAVDHALHQSAISKIESPGADGRRSISIGEAIGFSKVFGIPLGELLLPRDSVRDAAAWRRFVEAAEQRNEMRTLASKYENSLQSLQRVVRESADFRDRLQALRVEMIAKLRRELQDIAETDGEPFDERDVEANRTPIVIVIDEVLAAVEEGNES